ncbi:hypothetical protein AB0Y14_12340 [Rothia sp. HC945]|uniref:hypothetical protein n=1 Tax=Rothia sp. HC945 TaxID=3171170 RepID=UPI003F25E25E
MQTHVLRARDASTAAIAAEIRPFILAGWNVGDISHALTYSPSGSQHWHSDSGFFRAETWMRYRLAEWMRDGMPIRSESQRRESERAEAEARRRAEAAETAARRRRQAVQTQSPVGPGRSKVRAMLAQRRGHNR